MLRKPTKSGWLAGKPKTVVEIKSSKVECISFHAKQPLILASLESGEIELWNYRWRSLIHRFQHRHVGPVRSVNFHKKAALFVSGGDDSKVCVWDCKTFRHSFTLFGHTKPIRSVEFHHDGLPLIISASVDKTIRIWNFQSRTLVSVLNGHTGCVMSASFHPARDLILSASLDRTVRVWGFEKICGPEGLGLSVEVKHVLQGHTEGVNSASFHPTELLVVSGGKDCTVKLWDISCAKDVAVTTLNGHKNYVSAAVFYSKGPVKRHVIVSVSQDKSIILWNGLERKILENFTCTDDRFWCLAVHPETKLLAAGHNSGVFVFKLQRERPAFAVSGNTLVYAKDQGLHQGLYRLDLSLYSPGPGRASGLAFGAVKSIGSWNPLTSLCYCPEAEAVVACSDRGGGSYEMVDTQRDDSLFSWENYHEKGNPDSKFCACLVTKERCAVLEIGTNRLHLKTLKGILLRTFLLPYMADAISYAGVNNVLCRSRV